MNQEAIKDLLYRLADDELIIGHRNSEWTGIGPILEEDIAFSSMAQDEVGHAQAYYILLHELFGDAKPDTLAFNRKAGDFRCCQLVEFPIDDYAFSLVRHFLYDMAEAIRLEHLMKCSWMPLSELAKKLSREEKYHQLHAVTWITQLGNATEDSKNRLQNAINTVWPMALSIFEPTDQESALEKEGILPKESVLEKEWTEKVSEIITASGLKVPFIKDPKQYYGGRQGKHSEHLQPMLNEMNEVFAIDPAAAW